MKIGESRLREIFLKTDNYIEGRYLAELTKGKTFVNFVAGIVASTMPVLINLLSILSITKIRGHL